MVDIAETAIYTNVQCCKINFDEDRKTNHQSTMPIYPDVVFLRFASPSYTMSTFPSSLHFTHLRLCSNNLMHISHQLMFKYKCKYFFPAILDDSVSVHRKTVFINIDCFRHAHFM